jgi:hypothetical protein
MSQKQKITIEAHKSAMAKNSQAFNEEQGANQTAFTATDGPIEAYRNAPCPATRAAALEAIAIRNQLATLMQIFPVESVDLFQRQSVHSYLTKETDSISDSLDARLSEILSIYPKARESIASRIAEFGRKALALAGVERADAFASRAKDEDLLIYIETETLRCNNAITYFKANPSLESFNTCDGVLGILAHEIQKAAAA